MHKVCVFGSGNFGTTVAKVVAENVVDLKDFDSNVHIWVHTDCVDGRSLTATINESHENPKYLPGITLPSNIVAYHDPLDALQGCDHLIFVMPHQYVTQVLSVIADHVLPNSTALSCIKGVSMENDHITLVTDVISQALHIPCGSLMGANIASEIARGEFCETTIAFDQQEDAQTWFSVLNNEYFQVKIVTDCALQQLCGTLKNVVAMGAGFVDGLGYGQNSKSAIIRMGIEEIFRFAVWYYPDRTFQLTTMFETCGIADVVATAYGGRNRRCAEEFARTGKDFHTIEVELLKGQRLEGNLAAAETFSIIRHRKAIQKFPLLSTISMICSKQVPVETIIRYRGKHLENVE